MNKNRFYWALKIRYFTIFYTVKSRYLKTKNEFLLLLNQQGHF